jgi:hypothetical protein
VLRALHLPVILALAAGAARAEVHAVTQVEIDAAITRGVAHLLELYGDGEGRDFGTVPGATPALVERPGLRALTAYALLKSGVDPGNAVLTKLIRRLSIERVDTTYDAACLLLALVALDPVGQRAWIEELAHFLVEHREKAGDFGYPGGGDLSNSQFGAFALRAAVSAGVAVPSEVWTDLSRAALRYQVKDGGFGYMVSTRSSSSTMSAAGVGVLAICEIELARAGSLDDETAGRLRRARADGLEWLARQKDYGREDDHESWRHYFLYGLERAATLCALERIGSHDWYREGATYLVAHQDGHGDWPGTFERAPTLFALLFLSRATSGAATFSARSPQTGPLPRPFPHAAGSDKVGGMRLDVEGSRALHLWVSRIASPANAAFERPNEHGRGPHVALVEFVADGRTIEVVLGDASRAVGEKRFECVHTGLARGRHLVAARVHVCPLAGESGESVIETNGVDVEIAADAPVSIAEPVFDPALDLVLAAGPRADASSVCSGGPDGIPFAARSAVDGNPRTPWIADAADQRPTLEIHFTEPVRANVVRIAPARIPPRSPDFLTLPREIAVAVNGGAPRALVVNGSPRTWFEARLDRAEIVRSLEIRLGGREVDGASVGIGEVVLLSLPD